MTFLSSPFSEYAVIERLGWVLVHSIWQFAVIALLATVAARVLCRTSSALRYGVLVATLGFMVATTVVTWVVMPVYANVTMASREASASQTPGERQDVSPPITVPDTVATTEFSPDENTRWADASPLANAISDALRPWMSWIVSFWSIGVLLCSLRPLLGWRTLRRLRRIGISAPSDEILTAFARVSARLGLNRAVQVFNSTLAKGPLLVGYLRPIVLLPVSLATSIPTPQLEAILPHELAHVRRHDFLINLLQTLIETVFFYHPAVWWLSHRIRIEREHCCDDLVVKLFNNAPDYGRALLAIEQLQGQTTSLALGAKDGSLLRRIQRIVNPELNHAANRSWLVLPLILCMCSITAISTIHLRSVEGLDERKRDNLMVPAIAKLPGNIEVELIGVDFYPSNGKAWWRPDGSEQTHQPDISDAGSFTIGSDAKARENCREFVLQIRGLPKDHSIRTAYGDGVSAATGSIFKDGVWMGHHGAGPFRNSTTSIKLSIATEPYGPVMTIDSNGKKSTSIAIPENLGALYDRIAPVRVNDESGEIQLELDNLAYGELYRLAAWELHAIDNDGVQHRQYTEFVPDMPDFPRELRFSLPKAEFSHFEYRLRPYRHFVTFENVSLEPGKQTDVKLSIEAIGQDPAAVPETHSGAEQKIPNANPSVRVLEEPDANYTAGRSWLMFPLILCLTTYEAKFIRSLGNFSPLQHHPIPLAAEISPMTILRH